VFCADATTIDDSAIPCGSITCADFACHCVDPATSTCSCGYGIATYPPPDLPA
jgi:hypothetical protein